MVNPRTFGELYQYAVKSLGSAFEAKQLFRHATGKSAFDLPLLGDKPAQGAQVEVLLALCARRGQGEPLQYLLGEWEFYGLPFRVGPGVLIPRPDTECLVEQALVLLREIPSPQVLDLCSGTGCVAIAVAHHRPDAVVTALELSHDAYPYLLENIRRNQSPVRPVHGDAKGYTHPQPLHLILSNPPYIPAEDIPHLQQEVRREPRQALDGGADGLDFYRAIAGRYRPQLLAGGHLCLEIGVGQGGGVTEILTSQGFSDIAIRNDLNGVPRVVQATRTA